MLARFRNAWDAVVQSLRFRKATVLRPARHESDPGAVTVRTRPKWHLVYYSLAAFDLLTVAGSLYLNHTLISISREAVVTNQQWANRLGQLTELSRLAQRTNAPGNDVFDSHNVPVERARRDQAIGEFQKRWLEIRTDLIGNGLTENEAGLLASMARIQRAMSEMSDEAEQIFGYFEREEIELAGRRMATMDRKYADLTSAIGQAIREVQSIQFELLRAQADDSEGLASFEYWIMAFIGIMILTVMLYGHKIAQVMRRYDQEQSAARLDAQNANRAKSEFLAKMSHEIRTPMNGVLTTAELLERSDLTPAQQKLVGIVRTSGKSLLALIDEILDLSKVDAGKLRLQPVDFDLTALVVEVSDLFAPGAAAKQIKLSVQLPVGGMPLLVHADSLRLRQVLTNLVSNAIKFTSQGEVGVELRSHGERNGRHDVSLVVADTGIGLDREFQTRMFHPFAQAEETAARSYGGTGLGLSIAKQIVDLLGGEIAVESEIGRGTRFEVSLLLPKASMPAVALGKAASVPQLEQEHRGGAGTATRRGKILIAEDNLVNQQVMAESLGKLGYEFAIVDDGRAAIEALAKTRYDAVLMDCRMPGMNGYDATRNIRKSESERGGDVHVPIIAVSANAMVGDRERCLNCGMDDHLAKPFTIDELDEAIARWLPGPRTADGEPSGANRAKGNPGITAIDKSRLAMLASFQRLEKPSIVARIVDSYIAKTPGTLERIGDALTQNDLSSVGELAHGLISSSGNVGAMEFAKACRELELLAGQGKTALARAKFSEISDGFPGVKRQLDSYASARPSPARA